MPEDDAIKDSPPAKPRGRIGTVIGDYTVEVELGRGGMGVVYRARQGELNRLVALKMLTGHYGDNELQRFLAEAQTAAALQHTNIVHIYEVGEIDGAPFFSMEFVEGGTLGDQLRKGLPTPRKAAELLMPIARALHFAHQHGVIHRDMKPGNVLIDPDGVPKVADFGIAKRLSDDSQLTLSGAIIGTPTYMAPEQAGGTSRNVGPAADVYSLGAMLYEMLTGRPPFLPDESETPMTVRILSEATPSPAWHRPEIPREIEIICMKCLQKDPRDRYSSAAAFAEDLRRFLDDEGILARPPSRIVQAIKWARRHPWKFTGSIALVLLAVFGGRALYQWEFYQRLRTEYAASVTYVNGALEPAMSLKKSETAWRAVSLKFTRRGRFGPVTKIEVLNPRGHPASIRRLMIEEPIPIYIESLLGSQPNSEKSVECSVVEQFFDGQNIREITGRSRDGTVTWRILYDPLITSAGESASTRARFVNVRGIEQGSREGATLMEFDRDSAGHDVRVGFLNSGGRPAKNGEGTYGYKMERDSAGRLVRLFNLGLDGKPAQNREGITGVALTWDAAGRPVRMELLDETGRSTPLNGVAAFVTDYDGAGNAIRVRRLGADGQFARRGAMEWVLHEISRDAHGQILGRKYFRSDENGTPVLLSELTYDYDDNGHPAKILFSGAAKGGTALRHDVNGNLTEEGFLDGDGRPVVGERGYAIRRIAYQPGPDGMRVVESYFDVAGAPTFCTAGYGRFINEYDATGSLHRQIMDEHDPKRFTYSRFVSETDFGLRGRLLHSVNRFEDGKGQLAVNAGMQWTTQEEDYDENGRALVTWQSGWSVEESGAPVWRKDTEWQNSGIMRRRVWQAYDEKRKALDTVATLDPAHTEEEFDAVGKIERKLETGFNESKRGFRTRELSFLSGKLQRVTFRNSQGAELKDTRVVIIAIAKDAQAKSRALKVGDELLTANGEKVGSAYEWMLSYNFPGGFIEIMRDGQRLKIEGFEAGKIGLLLDDRGPGEP